METGSRIEDLASSFHPKHTEQGRIDKLKTVLRSKGVTLFALIDHSGERKKWDENASHQALDLRQSE